MHFIKKICSAGRRTNNELTSAATHGHGSVAMRAAGLLLRAAGLLLLLVVLPARGQEWITRWADDGDCVVDEDDE